MSIQAIKGVEIGAGFGYADLPGRQVLVPVETALARGMKGFRKAVAVPGRVVDLTYAGAQHGADTGADAGRFAGTPGAVFAASQGMEPGSDVLVATEAFLAERDLKTGDMRGDLTALSRLGVPYSKASIAAANDDVKAQADPDSGGGAELQKRYPKAQVRDFDGDPKRLTEMDALVAYLQMLGTLVDFSTYDDATGYR